MSDKLDKRARIWITIIALSILTVSLSAQPRKPFALLRQRTATNVSRFCSREGVANVTGSWRPNQSDIEVLESHLGDIRLLKTNGLGRSIPIISPNQYYRQYIGIVVEGRELIYVNAFSGKPPSYWRERIVDICDSGAEGWGAIFDPKHARFYNLNVNRSLPAPPPPPK
jgi:hypothetical protein